MTSGPITAWQMGKGGRRKGRSSDRFPLLGLQNHCGWWLQPWNQRMIASWQESDDKSRQCVEKQRCYFADKGQYSQGYVFSGSYLWFWELDHKVGKAQKNWFFRFEVLEKTLESPLDSKGSNWSILKEINPEYSLEGLMLKLKVQYFGRLMLTNNSLEKTLMLGKVEGRGSGNRGWDSWMASPMQ